MTLSHIKIGHTCSHFLSTMKGLLKTVPPCDVSSRTICAKNRMGLFVKKGETIRSKSVLWVGSPIIVLEVLKRLVYPIWMS